MQKKNLNQEQLKLNDYYEMNEKNDKYLSIQVCRGIWSLRVLSEGIVRHLGTDRERRDRDCVPLSDSRCTWWSAERIVNWWVRQFFWVLSVMVICSRVWSTGYCCCVWLAGFCSEPLCWSAVFSGASDVSPRSGIRLWISAWRAESLLRAWLFCSSNGAHSFATSNFCMQMSTEKLH